MLDPDDSQGLMPIFKRVFISEPGNFLWEEHEVPHRHFFICLLTLLQDLALVENFLVVVFDK